MLSLSDGPVLSLIWVDERPWGHLSASPCPVPRAEIISHGHTLHPPRAKGLCTVTHHSQGSPYLLHLWPPTEGAGGCLNQPLFAGGVWAVGLHRPGGSHCPHVGLGTEQPALWLGAVHSKPPQTSSREGTVCTGSTIRRPGFSPPCECSCLHPGQTLVTLAWQPKHPLMSCEMELGPGCQRTQAASSWPPCCFSHCLWDIINFLCWKGSFQLSRDPLGLKVSESDFQSTGHPFLSRAALERQWQHS